jgi:uncharacterized protein (DUF3820 family)
MKMTADFTLKFGKFKGQTFSNTPVWYQTWLLKQEWFKSPSESKKELSTIDDISKEMSGVANSLKGWDGYSRKGAYAEDRMFELEMAVEDALYCDCGNRKDEDESHCGCRGIYSL